MLSRRSLKALPSLGAASMLTLAALTAEARAYFAPAQPEPASVSVNAIAASSGDTATP